MASQKIVDFYKGIDYIGITVWVLNGRAIKAPEHRIPMRKKVVITGLGVVSPVGIGKERFWEAIKSGRSGVGRITRFDSSPFPVQIAAEVRGFDPGDYMAPKTTERTERSTHFAVAAAKMAMEDSGLAEEYYDQRRTGVAIGTAVGGLMFALKQHSTLIEKGPMEINPFTASIESPNASSSQVSIQLHAKGPSLTFSTACTSAFGAAGYALNAIRKGEMDVMIVGGTEAPLFPTIFSAFCLSRIMSTWNEEPIRTPSPFDRYRDGIVLGEGAGILVLEELDHAVGRNAHIYAEVLGYGTTSDAYHMVAIDSDREASVRAIRLALRDAGLEPEEVDYIHAHGSGTRSGDEGETMAIKKAFGRHAYRIGVSSTKSMLGHTQGAAGALEAIVCALAIEHNLIPPTINYEYPDPRCDLDYVPNKARYARINVAMSNCFGFGGKNAVLILKRFS